MALLFLDKDAFMALLFMALLFMAFPLALVAGFGLLSLGLDLAALAFAVGFGLLSLGFHLLSLGLDLAVLEAGFQAHNPHHASTMSWSSRLCCHGGFGMPLLSQLEP
eukprot:s1322_g2.t1